MMPPFLTLHSFPAKAVPPSFPTAVSSRSSQGGSRFQNCKASCCSNSPSAWLTLRLLGPAPSLRGGGLALTPLRLEGPRGRCSVSPCPGLPPQPSFHLPRSPEPGIHGPCAPQRTRHPAAALDPGGRREKQPFGSPLETLKEPRVRGARTRRASARGGRCAGLSGLGRALSRRHRPLPLARGARGFHARAARPSSGARRGGQGTGLRRLSAPPASPSPRQPRPPSSPQGLLITWHRSP